MNTIAFALLALASLVLSAGAAHAQPDSRPLRILVSTPPGSAPDIVARMIAPRVGESLNRPVVVENRVGVNGALAAQAVAQAEPDGATVLLCPSGTIVINPLLYRNLAADPLRDLAPVAKLAQLDFLLLSHSALGARSLDELRTVAASRKGGLSAAMVAPGTTGHLALELLQLQGGVPMTIVAFKGSPQAAQAVAARDADIQIEALSVTDGLIKLGKLVPLASTGRVRNPLLPKVPTLQEIGLPGIEIVAWNGVFVPAKTPPQVVERLASAFRDAILGQDTQQKLRSMGLQPAGVVSADFRDQIRAEHQMWGEVVRKAGIKLE